MDLVLSLAVALAGCRGPLTGLDAGGPPDSAPGAPLCPSLTWERPRSLALVLASGGEITFVRADGSREVAYRATAEVSSLSVHLAGKLVFVAGFRADPGQTHFEAVALDHDGQVRWRHRTVLPGARYLHPVFVDGRGAAAFGLRGGLETTLTVLADGTAHELPGVSPLGLPDDAGWLAVSRLSPADPTHPAVGLMQVGMTEPRPLARRRLRWPMPLVLEAARTGLLYLGEENGRWTLVEEHPDQTREFPLPVPVSEQWFHVQRSGKWVLVAQGNEPAPRWLVDLEGGQLHALPALAAPRPIDGGRRPEVASAGRWFLGHDGLHPLWRLDAATRELVAVDLAPLAPLAPFDDARYCASPPGLLEDGRLALALRGPSFGGFFVGHPGHRDWMRVGHAFSGVDVLGGERTGGTWIVSAGSFEYTFCPPPAPWTAPGPGDPRPVFGLGLHLIPPAPALPLVLPPKSQIDSLHPTGLCGVIDGQIIDLPTGHQVALGARGSTAWP